jgi:hypothetical protein
VAQDPRDQWSCPMWQAWCVGGTRKQQRPRYLGVPEQFKARVKAHVITYNKIRERHGNLKRASD